MRKLEIRLAQDEAGTVTDDLEGEYTVCKEEGYRICKPMWRCLWALRKVSGRSA